MSEPDFAHMSEQEVRHLVDSELERCMQPRWRRVWWDETDFFGQTPLQMLKEHRYRKVWLLARAMGQPYEVDLGAIEREEPT